MAIIATNTKPFQGLKQMSDGYHTFDELIATNTKPFQGLKQESNDQRTRLGHCTNRNQH